MRRSTLGSLVIWLILYSSSLIGQNNCTTLTCDGSTCPDISTMNCFQTVNSGNLQNLQSNRTYCITGTVTIQSDIPSGTIIYISSTGVANTSNINQFAGRIINCGTFNQGNSTMGNGSAVIENYGVFNSSTNTLSSENDTIINHASGQLIIHGEWNMEHSDILNCGLIEQNNSSRSLNLRNGTCFKNNQTSDVLVDGNFTVGSGAAVDNFGTIFAEKDININSNGNLYNDCSLYSYTRITCDGTLVNNALILCDDPNNDSPSFGEELVQISNGFLTNNGLIIGNEFSNGGVIDGIGGSFHFLGATTNNGIFGGTPEDNLNFYDTTNNNTSPFDNGSPTNNTTSEAFSRPGNDNRLVNTCASDFLPIELIYFKADKINNSNNQISIKWATAVEINNEYFEIYHSVDNQRWTILTRVAGQINSNITQYYEYIHNEIPFSPNGIHYYKLKQTDTDGSFSFSSTKAIQLKQFTRGAVLFPNPIELGSTLAIKHDKIESISIINQLGEQVDYHIFENTSNLVYLPTHHLSHGYYTIHINGTSSFKLMVSKK